MVQGVLDLIRLQSYFVVPLHIFKKWLCSGHLNLSSTLWIGQNAFGYSSALSLQFIWQKLVRWYKACWIWFGLTVFRGPVTSTHLIGDGVVVVEMVKFIAPIFQPRIPIHLYHTTVSYFQICHCSLTSLTYWRHINCPVTDGQTQGPVIFI